MTSCCKLKAADPLPWERLGQGGYFQGGALGFDSAGYEGERWGEIYCSFVPSTLSQTSSD